MGIGELLSKISGYVDPKKVDLVKKIATKTREGKISWERSPIDFSASVGTALKLSFIYSSGLLSNQWKQFTVRDDKGREVLEVSNPEVTLGSLLTGTTASKDPLVESVDELFKAVSGQVKGDLEKAIEVVDRV